MFGGVLSLEVQEVYMPQVFSLFGRVQSSAGIHHQGEKFEVSVVLHKRRQKAYPNNSLCHFIFFFFELAL